MFLEGTYVFVSVGADPYREGDVVTALARRKDRRAAPLLHTVQCQSGPYCLKSILENEEELRNYENKL